MNEVYIVVEYYNDGVTKTTLVMAVFTDELQALRHAKYMTSPASNSIYLVHKAPFNPARYDVNGDRHE